MNLKRFCISAPASIHAYKMANLAGIQALFYSHFTTYDVYWDSKPRLLLKFEGSETQSKVLINVAAGISGQSDSERETDHSERNLRWQVNHEVLQPRGKTD